MPHYDINEAMKYAGDKITADAEVDLTGMTEDAALARLAEAIDNPRAQHRSLIVRFAPARPGEGETLFQPVGRYLLEKRREGAITKLENLLELGAGFYIELNTDAPDDETANERE